MAINYGNTIPSYSNVTITAGGTGGTGVLTGGYYNNSWTSYSNGSAGVVSVSAGTQPSLKVSGDADITGTLKVRGIDVSEVLTKIQDRLAILVPDPMLLEKYDALKQAYDHYKTLEALCVDATHPNQ